MYKSQQYDLSPGDGVFIPASAPHMVENGCKDYTISLTITYMSQENYRIQRIYKMNQLLRKIGFNPTDANQSKIKDKSKILGHALLRSLLFYNKHWR